MTLDEEKVGWNVTMKSWGHAVFLAGLGSEGDLKPYVAVPKDLVKLRKDIALVMSDQVPIWLKIGKRKIVFAEHEVAVHSKSSKKFKEGVEKANIAQDIQESQKPPPIIEKLAKKQAEEGMSQRISGGQGDGADEKFRITLECRHAVLDFFAGDGRKPRSVQLPPILIS